MSATAGTSADAGGTPPAVADRLQRLLRERVEPGARFFEAEAGRVAELCRAMAERFARGGRLIAFGTEPAARSDVRHVVVEFVHPVIVGKRALPALGLLGEDPAAEVALLARADDIALGFGASEATARAIAAARARGCATVAFAPLGAEWELEPPVRDEAAAQELVETLYHVLWELVHVFFEHRAVTPAGQSSPPAPGHGPSLFLYPFLTAEQSDPDELLEDVRRSVLMKAADIAALREQTLTENAEALYEAASDLRSVFERGGTLLALGNGGSATDAMDAVADFRTAAEGRRARPAIDLTEDPAILTAIANDVGVEAIFSRQVIAYGSKGDALLALSTSGGSANVIEALAEARGRGLITIAMVGYDGGRIAHERLADHVVVTRSQHIPRIQEAQASAYHALRELVG
jgi:D-sedoheptulose 7-phosphate isomerase